MERQRNVITQTGNSHSRFGIASLSGNSPLEQKLRPPEVFPNRGDSQSVDRENESSKDLSLPTTTPTPTAAADAAATVVLVGFASGTREAIERERVF